MFSPKTVPSRWLVVVALAFVVAAAAAAPANGEPTDAPCDADLEAIIAQLGHTDYDRRAAGQAELHGLDPACQRKLGTLYHTADDPEVRMRLRLFARQYFEREVLPRYEALRRPGFLGISHTLQRLPDGKLVIRVVRVLPGTGAAAAGLRAGDQILELDGEGINGGNPTQAFSERIKAIGEGGKATLKILRGGDPMRVEATLGAVPGNVDARSGQIQRKIERLRQHWFEHAFLKGKLKLDRTPDLDQLLAEAGEPGTGDGAAGGGQAGLIIRGGNVQIRGNQMQIRGNVQIKRLQIQQAGADD